MRMIAEIEAQALSAVLFCHGVALYSQSSNHSHRGDMMCCFRCADSLPFEPMLDSTIHPSQSIGRLVVAQ
jgi:hypothetical protein